MHCDAMCAYIQKRFKIKKNEMVENLIESQKRRGIKSVSWLLLYALESIIIVIHDKMHIKW